MTNLFSDAALFIPFSYFYRLLWIEMAHSVGYVDKGITKQDKEKSVWRTRVYLAADSFHAEHTQLAKPAVSTIMIEIEGGIFGFIEHFSCNQVQYKDF